MPTLDPESSERTAVVVEDQTLFRKLLVRAIRTHPGIRVVGEAADGESALKVCREKKPDLLLLDLDLPRLSGVEVARTLRDELPNTKILVLSASDQSAKLRDALRSGICGLVDKDQAFEVVSTAIDAVLNGETYFTGLAARELRLMPSENDEILETLTSREKEILRMVAQGTANKEVADALEISTRTVEVHRHNLMKKLGVRNAAELASLAARIGLKL